MTIYISGKITGLPIEEAKAKFQAAEDHLLDTLKSYNPIILNPFKLDHAKAYALEAVLEREINFPPESKSVTQEDIWRAYMDVDMSAVLKSDAIYMLKNWGHSKGARIEYSIAKEKNIPISYEQ